MSVQQEKDAAIGKFVESQVEAKWQAIKQPFFLSNIAPALKVENLSYREYIGEERLKSAMIRLSETYSFKVIEHPTKRAKIGLIPKYADFNFVSDTSAVTDTAKMQDDALSQGATEAASEFLNALARLPPDLLDGISIPATTLARLLQKK